MKQPSRSRSADLVVATIKDPHRLDAGYADRAVGAAAGLGCELVFVHVAWSPYAAAVRFAARSPPQEDLAQRLREEARLALGRWVARAQGAGVRARAVVLWGWPESGELVRYAMRTRPRLVLARSPARPPTGRLFTPYHDWELLRGMPAPLLLVRTARPATGPVLAAVDPLHPREDGARLDERIVARAAEFATATGAALELVHVAALPAEILVRGRRPERVRVAPALRAQQRRRAAAALTRLAAAAGVPMRARRVLAGDPADELVREARRQRAAVLVMGVVSRSFLQRAILGSTAEAVLRAAPCDLLLVKPAGFRPSPRALG